MRKYNLIVIGGGLAGVGAALAAARSGLKVLLVERANCLGGAASNCLVNPFMPYWTHVQDGSTKKKFYLSGGIFREILEQLDAVNALDSNESVFKDEYLKLILNRMVIKEGIQLLFHSQLVDVAVENHCLKSVTIACKSGKIEVCADYFVDATGDGDLAVLSGCGFQLGRETDNLCQPMTLCFRVANVDMAKYNQSRKNINGMYKELQEKGVIKNLREDVLIFPTMAEGILHFNSTRIVKMNPTDAFDLTEAEIQAREQVFELFDFLVSKVDGFQNSYLVSTAPQIGVRESRMIHGEYTLTAQDIMSCHKFDDVIAVGNYDIDIHNPEGGGTSHYYFPDGQFYTIPYRCLVPKGKTNLLVAGRCVSASHEAQASIRILPIVCCLGEAAGRAAGVAFADSVKANEIDVTKLQAILENSGAIIRPSL